MTADLHCHTRLSDGSLGIEDLILLAKKRGVTTLAITDHDCLAGTVRGKVIGKRHGVDVIPGVELSAFDPARGRKVHLLCYLAENPDRLEGLCKRTALARRRAGQYMIIRAAQRYPITPEFVLKCAAGSTSIYKQHIMHALMEAGFTSTIFGDLFQELFSKDSENHIVVDVKYPDCREVLEAIHDAGGIAVLAHPAEYDSFDLLEELIPLGLDGVEVWHPSCSPEDTERLLAIAQQHDILATGGSDFHGMYGRQLSLGAFSTPKEHLDRLMSYKVKQRRQQRKAAQAQLLLG